MHDSESASVLGPVNQSLASLNELLDKSKVLASWIDDITQALQNLGGQATLSQIYDEVRRIRQESLPKMWQHIIQDTIYQHSSDTRKFKGNDLFHKVDKGVWALREQMKDELLGVDPAIRNKLLSNSVIGNREEVAVVTWVEDIVQALKNLGGRATEAQIQNEVKRIRKGHLPSSWKNIINHRLGDYSSDTSDFKNEDFFQKVDKGVWALRNQNAPPQQIHQTVKQKTTIPRNYLPTEPLEEIENVLRTIKQYRDYQHPDTIAWREYVDEFFHILGFSTENKNSRLMTLSLMGANHTPRVIVCYINPAENFEEITHELTWESYLFFAAHYYQIEWGVLTDGLQLKVIHYKGHEPEQLSYWPDLDSVVKQERLDTFCTIYKVLSYIKHIPGSSSPGRGKT